MVISVIADFSIFVFVFLLSSLGLNVYGWFGLIASWEIFKLGFLSFYSEASGFDPRIF